MASAVTELATLRAITFRISSTTTSQLPQHVPAIAASLTNCKTLLSSSQSPGSKASSEISVAVHKYRTLLSTLLQDRTVQGRWAAIVLIKATIEAGGWETLQKSLPWVRGLLLILTKPDPPSSKKLCLITLTRIFVLTREYPTLVREITTPSLPTFIQHSLQIAASSIPAGLLQAILECFYELLPRHPTIFRPYLKQLQQLLGRIIAPTPSSQLGSEQTSSHGSETAAGLCVAAQRLYTQLPCCAPKGASTVEWQESYRRTAEIAHGVADKIFRGVVEEWKSPVHELSLLNGHTSESDVQESEPNSMGMPPWRGIFAGGERLVGLLRLVKEHLLCPTAESVSFNIGLTIDLITRLLSLTVPSSSAGQGLQNGGVKFNNQVTREERENLWLILPSVHVAGMEILLALLRRCDASTFSIDTVLLDYVVALFAAEKGIHQIRTACYRAISQLLMRSGKAMPKSQIEPILSIIRACCNDVLSTEPGGPSSRPPLGQNNPTSNNQRQATTNADSFLTSSKNSKEYFSSFDGLQEAARSLLPVLFAHIQPGYLSDSVRALLDRTAILACLKDSMIASILSPPPSRKFGKPTASLLPLLARLHPSERDVEGLLHPRMPVIRTGARATDDGDENSLQEEEVQDAGEGENFVGNELDSLLETANSTDYNADEVAKVDAISAPTTGHLLGNSDEVDIGPTFTAQSERSGNKRPQIDVVLNSPAKRVKVDDEVVITSESLPVATATIPIAIAQSTAVPSETAIENLPTATTSQVSLPAASGPKDNREDDSDADDIVSLVLGQDTDEESE